MSVCTRVCTCALVTRLVQWGRARFLTTLVVRSIAASGSVCCSDAYAHTDNPATVTMAWNWDSSLCAGGGQRTTHTPVVAVEEMRQGARARQPAHRHATALR